MKHNPPHNRWWLCMLCRGDASGRPVMFSGRGPWKQHLRDEHGVTRIERLPMPPGQAADIDSEYFGSPQITYSPMIGKSMSTPGVCDFCAAVPVIAVYPCQDFVTVDPAGLLPDARMRGGWGACTACHALLDRGDYDRLAKRTWRRSNMDPASVPAQMVRLLHQDFRRHRTGPPILLGRSQN